MLKRLRVHFYISYITLNIVKLFFRSFCNARSLTFLCLLLHSPVELGLTKPLNTFLDVSRHSLESSILRHLVLKKTLGTAQCLSKYAIQGLKESVGLKLLERPFRG